MDDYAEAYHQICMAAHDEANNQFSPFEELEALLTSGIDVPTNKGE